MKDYEFVGRDIEIQKLRNLINSKNSNLGVIYGRRRVGKSELVKKAFEGKKLISLEGLENRPKKNQIENFMFHLNYQLEIKQQRIEKGSWKEAFIALHEAVKDNPCHIFLDEFQWMANYRSEIISDLKLVWDQYLSKIEGLTLILCGSIASFMTTQVIKSNAFYGRIDLHLNLKPFTLSETQEILKNHGLAEVTEAYMFSGGVPKYLNILKDKASIRLGIEEEAFTDSGYFIFEYERIFLSHFGKNKGYQSIIKALASHPYGLFRKELAEKAGIQLGGLLSEHLNNLESAGFISSQTPFNKQANSRHIKYFLSDAYLRFYFAFVHPNLKKIKSGGDGIFQKLSQTGAFYNWQGRSFEYISILHANKIAHILGFSGIDYTHGPFFKPPGQETSGLQIDLIFNRADNVLTLCEMKYSLQKTGSSVIEEMERKTDILKQLFKSKTIQKVLVTNQKPTEGLLSSGYFYRVITTEELI